MKSGSTNHTLNCEKIKVLVKKPSPLYLLYLESIETQKYSFVTNGESPKKAGVIFEARKIQSKESISVGK